MVAKLNYAYNSNQVPEIAKWDPTLTAGYPEMLWAAIEAIASEGSMFTSQCMCVLNFEVKFYLQNQILHNLLCHLLKAVLNFSKLAPQMCWLPATSPILVVIYMLTATVPITTR